MRLFSDERVDEFLREGWWNGKTFSDLLAEHATARPDRVALVDPANREAITDGPARRLTWGEVQTEVHRLARALYRCGVRKDDVVGVQLPNTVELAVIYLATASVGAIACSFPVQYARHELTQMGNLAGLAAFVTVTRANKSALADQAMTLRESIPTLHSVLAWGQAVPDGAVVLDDELENEAQDQEFVAYRDALTPHPNDCVTLSWTSGTEGFPKGVPRAHGDWQVVSMGTIAEPQLTPDDVLLNPFPMVNAGGMAGMFMPWLVLGAQLVQHHPFDLKIFLQQIQDERVTYTCAPPAVLDALVSSPDALADYDISSLRAVGSGSAPLAAWMIEAWERDRGVEVLNLFGSNEGLILYGCPDTIPDPAERGRLFPRPGDPDFAWRTRPLRHMLSRLVDLETGADITEPGRAGELRVFGPTLFAGYWGGVASPFDEQGFYRTGDIFEFTDEGNRLLVYIDRAKDLISRGGYKISAAEIEGLLATHPKVAEVALVGMPDERLGERPCAFVVPRTPEDPPTQDELVSHLESQHVARFKWPERLEIIDVLPRNPIGKILKRSLRDQLRAQTGAAAGGS